MFNLTMPIIVTACSKEFLDIEQILADISMRPVS